MSESQPSRVFLFDNSDPEMQRAYENARVTFRYFWREIAWERRRIVPALDLACVKAPFSDGEQDTRIKDTPEVEHMWLSEVDFDGQFVSGVLLNAPNWLKTVKEGDIVSRADFNTAVNNLDKEKSDGRDRELPQKTALVPASGITIFQSVTLLPGIQFTIPMLLLAVSLWLAWRIVNMPTFADFLIATEAELNKVSWTTQKRLVQDTIVVLVTVVLMSVFLFGMDWTWKVVLSWERIGKCVLTEYSKLLAIG